MTEAVSEGWQGTEDTKQIHNRGQRLYQRDSREQRIQNRNTVEARGCIRGIADNRGYKTGTH